jgi:hypothetical protein
MAEDFAAVREAGLKIIPRFAYNPAKRSQACGVTIE